MIAVDADCDGEWDSRIDWAELAQRCAGAAIAHSNQATLNGSSLLVEISVKFTSDAEVRALNAAYRSRDTPTNVLSFPMLDADLLPSLATAEDGEILLGDEICPDTCRLWDSVTRKKLDKDRFRQDLGEIEEAYQEVHRRVAAAV